MAYISQYSGQQIDHRLNEKTYLFKGYHLDGPQGDIDIDKDIIRMNNIVINEGNCYDGEKYICPEDGYYFASFSYYSNNNSTSISHYRAKINIEGGNPKQEVMVNGDGGRCVSTIMHCNKGTKIFVSTGSFSLNFYQAIGHNSFVVMKIK